MATEYRLENGITVNHYPSYREAFQNDFSKLWKILMFGKEAKYFRGYGDTKCDSSDKYTLRCQCCISLLIIGAENKKTGKEISSLLHIAPGIFNIEEDYDLYFKALIEENIKRFKINSKIGSGVGIIMGGYNGKNAAGRNYIQEYRTAVETVGDYCKSANISLIFARGPKLDKKYTDVFFDNTKRLLILVEGGQTLPVQAVNQLLPPAQDGVAFASSLGRERVFSMP